MDRKIYLYQLHIFQTRFVNSSHEKRGQKGELEEYKCTFPKPLRSSPLRSSTLQTIQSQNLILKEHTTKLYDCTSY
jgi:hypothetical protein